MNDSVHRPSHEGTGPRPWGERAGGTATATDGNFSPTAVAKPGMTIGRGPFNPAVNAMLSACFGNMIEDLPVKTGEGAKNRSIAAKAHTIGNKISLGDEISQDPRDGHSMEVIAHEVAHALAFGGSGRDIVNKPGDPGEAAAYDAGRGFRNFVESGAQGAPPKLSPAHGGLAAIHRWEAGEHADVVDNATAVLEQEKTHKGAIDVTSADFAATKKTMAMPIKLGNGLTVTPGEISAMMGDFYGVFEKDKKDKNKEHFDPVASFEALNSADATEMQRILTCIRKEKTDVHADIENKTKTYKPTEAGKLDAITGGRLVELAKKNSAHFSSSGDETIDGHLADNNMGAYSLLHQQALVEAAKGTPAAKEKARALEASAMHFLADRHASGHAIDKDKAVAASGQGNGLIGNGVARLIHNEYNDKGIDAEDASGDHWHAMGDSHWGERENKDNRFHTAKSAYNSYNELEAVLDGQKTPQQIQKDGYAAKQTVPKFDQDRQNEAEARAQELGKISVVKNNAGELWDYVTSYTGQKVEDGYDYVKHKAVGAYNWGKNKLSDGYDWTKQKASDAYDWGKEKLHNGVDWTKQKANDAYDWGKEKVHNGVDWTKQKASDAYDWGKEKLHNGVDWTKQKAGQVWNGTKDVANKTWEGTKSIVNTGWGGLKDAGNWLGNKIF
jgi:hypothetical protein